ncbi:MAG: pyridoxamine kinase [Clostridiales bacterium]|nr:pyridoxamine kinase [Clostridiales bacterium]
MKSKRILTVQDISCVGQCSITAALPVLSACGIETAVLPSAVLSTHTAGFHGFTFRDLSADIPEIIAHWQRENIKFDAVYTGYLGSAGQIDYVKTIFSTLLNEGGKKIVDPVMADRGRLYTGFDGSFVEKMKQLTGSADIILPNITEAALLTGNEYREEYGRDYIEKLISALHNGGAPVVILTGVGFTKDESGIAVSENGNIHYYSHQKIARTCHGTGDLYASSFAGAYLNGQSVFDAAVTAADFTLSAILNTVDDEEHWYGVKFEGVLPKLIERINLLK